MSENNPWGDLDDEPANPFGQAQDGVIDLTVNEPPDGDFAQDVESADKPVKRRSILPVLIGVVVVAVLTAGYVGYGLFQKMFPSQEVARSGGASLIDTNFTAAPGENKAEGEGSTTSLPVAPAGLGGSSLPISSGSESSIDEDLAPFAAVTGGNGGVEGAGSNTEPTSTVPAQAASEPIAVPAVAPVVAPAAVDLSPTNELVEAHAETSTPVAVPAAVAAPKKDLVVAPPVAPVANSTQAARDPLMDRLPQKKATTVGSAPENATPSRVEVSAAKPAAKTASQSHQRKAPPSTRPARQYTSTGRPKTSSDKAVAARGSKDLGALTAYSLLAIEPKHGQFQQAWVRDASGRVRIVGKGDVIDGARVTDVQFAKNRVMTDRGEIRK